MIYISGSITKDPKGSKIKFAAMEDKLIALGKECINPRRHDIPKEVKEAGDPELLWSVMMKKALIDMLYCDALVLLEGWEESRGARIEYMLAKHLGYTIYDHELNKMI